MIIGRVHFYEGCQVGKFYEMCAELMNPLVEGWQVGEVGRVHFFTRDVR